MRMPKGCARRAAYLSIISILMAVVAGCYQFANPAELGGTGDPEVPGVVLSMPFGEAGVGQGVEAFGANDVSDAGTNAVIVEGPEPAARSLKLYDPLTDAGIDFSGDFDAISGAFELSIEVYEPQYGAEPHFLLLSDTGAVAVHIEIDRHANLCYYTGAATSTIATYFGKFTYGRITVTGNTLAGTYDIGLDGTTIASDVPFKEPASNVSRFRLTTPVANDGTSYISSLSVSRL